jgi:hypothetical protein
LLTLADVCSRRCIAPQSLVNQVVNKIVMEVTAAGFVVERKGGVLPHQDSRPSIPSGVIFVDENARIRE